MSAVETYSSYMIPSSNASRKSCASPLMLEYSEHLPSKLANYVISTNIYLLLNTVLQLSNIAAVIDWFFNSRICKTSNNTSILPIIAVDLLILVDKYFPAMSLKVLELNSGTESLVVGSLIVKTLIV
jgi:hypothetical protein